MKNRLAAAVFFVALAGTLIPGSSHASVLDARPDLRTGITGPGEELGLSPFLDWKTLTTDHFRVTFPSGLEELAPVAAKNLEEAHRLLSPVMHWTPRFRTQVLLIDNSDFANGLAAASLRFGMVLWATPPDNWMSIAHYDDWFRLLAIHEYSHILNLDATSGFWAGLRILAGDATLPNALWPSWMLEGLAVTMETAFTRAGRGRSSYYGMILRAAEDSGVLADPDGLWRLSGPRTESPGGEVPYLFGNMLMTELASGDPGRLGSLSIDSSGRLPWLLNSYSKEVSGRDWSAHHASWLEKARARARDELASVRAAGETKLEPITDGNYSTLGIAFSPDGRWMAYSRESLERRLGIYLRDLSSGEELRVSDQRGGASLAFTPDSRGLVYSRVDQNGLYRNFSDLWVKDLPTGRITRLSDGARYRDPAMALGGDALVYTVNEPGRTGLGRSRLVREQDGSYQLADSEVIFRPGLLGRVSTPRISPDGSRVVFSLHENGSPGESIWQMVAGSAASRVTPEGEHFDRFPFFDPQGVLHFVSNRSGIDNVYRWSERDSQAVAITNTDTGLWLPAFSPAGRIAASHYRATGWDAVWVDVTAVPPAQPPRVPPISAVPVAGSEATGGAHEESVDAGASRWTISNYSIFPSLWPRSWAPFASYGTLEGWRAGALLVGFDALDLHRYLALLEYRPGMGEWGGDLLYANRSLGVVWTLHGARRVNSLGEQTYTRKTTAGLGLSLHYPRTFSAWNPSMEFAWEDESAYAYPTYRSVRGEGELARIIRSPTFQVQVEYDGTQASRQAVWPEEGFDFRLGNKWGRSTQLLWTQSHYLHLGGHVVLSPRWQISTSNRTSVRLEGRSGNWANAFSSPDFDQLVIRGYPLRLLAARQAGVAALDLRFPLRRVEKGWSTYPFFLRTVEGLGFAETSLYRGAGDSWSRLPSWGAGLKAGLTLFYSIPVSATLQYHQGAARGAGGRGEVFVDLQLGQLSF